MSLPEKNTARRKWVGLAIFIAVALIVGQIGGLITRGPVETWYPTLNKPSYNPPDWVFPVAWTAFYFLMGTAAWRVWWVAERRPGGWGEHAWLALSLYGAQLAINLGWSIFFFGLQSPLLGLVIVFFLAMLVFATLLAFKDISKLAAWLMAPYLAWVCFAAVLNFEIWRLN